MTSRSSRSPFWLGFSESLPFVFVVTPFALLFGVVSSEAGLDLLQTFMFSLTVFAGASQFTALQLMTDQLPTLIVIVTALAVNLRMAMYSAALTPYLGQAPVWKRVFIAYFIVDQSYALSAIRFEERADWELSDRIGYFFGTMVLIYPIWMATTVVGALLGTAIPEWLGLDFAVPLCFLAIIGPTLRTPAHIAAAVTSIVMALLLFWLPYSLGLLVAAVAAMMVGARVELWQAEART
ncbi:AzlC family ABC transporter permease [Flavimaricola marinus]|uniref:AzlC family ABC transporter permease n=1 Tax=Flavimaricola marinus TaxID=1819565 RepID=UPI000B8B4402|nr:AzlC family ABC transporter permease [Flavimaricola marinus]